MIDACPAPIFAYTLRTGEPDKVRTRHLTVDKLRGRDEAERFLRGVGLFVGEDVASQVVLCLCGKGETNLYRLYSARKDEAGEHVPSICGKGTAYKIKGLYEKGSLDPYVDYALSVHSEQNDREASRGAQAARRLGLGEDTVRRPRTVGGASGDGEGSEDPMLAAQEHRPALREAASTLRSQVRAGVPFPQLLELHWWGSKDYNETVTIRLEGQTVEVSLSVEDSPVFAALRNDHLPHDEAWCRLTDWKTEVTEVHDLLARVLNWVRDQTERIVTDIVGSEGQRLAEFLAKTVVLDVAIEKFGWPPDLEIAAQREELWTLRRGYEAFEDLAVDYDQEEFQDLIRLHAEWREELIEDPFLRGLAEAVRRAEDTRRTLYRELERISNIIKFPGVCSLYEPGP